MKQRSEKSMELYYLMLKRGYPEPFCDEVTRNLNTDWTAKRMIGYLSHYQKLRLEDIADEVLAILSDRSRIMDKKATEEANSRWNEMMWNGFPNEERRKMRILMLGNSFTFANNMPETLAELMGAEVIQHTRGGARLAEQLNPRTKMGKLTAEALEKERWDYVVLQEMSNGPITAKASFLKNTELLCEKIRLNGGVPVLYATWAYQKGGKQLETFGMQYEEMYQKMYDAYHEAADQNHALIADVGKCFYEVADRQDIYAPDGCHPNEIGSFLAARVIADTILAYQATQTEDK